MNVALPALVVFILVLPGFIFRDRFKRNEKTALDYAPFGRVVAEAVIWAAMLHAIWLAMAWIFRDQYLHIETLLGLLSSNSEEQGKAIRFVHQRAAWLGQYLASLLLASLLAPALLRFCITRCRLDRHGSLFAPFVRFHDAPWYYLLTGADFRKKDLPDYINVSAVVNIAGTPYLFQGMLDDFFFSADGQLDRLVLENVSRRPLSKDKNLVLPARPKEKASVLSMLWRSVSLPRPDREPGPLTGNDVFRVGEPSSDQRFYAVDGDYFVLRMSEAITLNVQYVRLEESRK